MQVPQPSIWLSDLCSTAGQSTVGVVEEAVLQVEELAAEAECYMPGESHTLTTH